MLPWNGMSYQNPFVISEEDDATHMHFIVMHLSDYINIVNSNQPHKQKMDRILNIKCQFAC